MRAREAVEAGEGGVHRTKKSVHRGEDRLARRGANWAGEARRRPGWRSRTLSIHLTRPLTALRYGERRGVGERVGAPKGSMELPPPPPRLLH